MRYPDKLLEDNTHVRRSPLHLASANLLAVGYEFAKAFPAESGGEHSDCIIPDVHLPGKSALELLSALTKPGLICPIIMMNPLDDQPFRSQANVNGAFVFLKIPFAGERLPEVIPEAVQTS